MAEAKIGTFKSAELGSKPAAQPGALLPDPGQGAVAAPHRDLLPPPLHFLLYQKQVESDQPRRLRPKPFGTFRFSAEMAGRARQQGTAK